MRIRHNVRVDVTEGLAEIGLGLDYQGAYSSNGRPQRGSSLAKRSGIT